MKTGFIGLGNMAKAMIGGMLAKKIAKPEDILGYAKTEETRNAVKEKYQICILENNCKVAEEADVLILAVKPQMFDEVINQIKDSISTDTLVISIAAGKTMDQIQKAFGTHLKLVRCMPNTPAMVGEGCSGTCRNEMVSDEEMDKCIRLLGSFGTVKEVPEGMMDAVGGVSGSSPAFVFMFIEALADGAVRAGMPRKLAYQFAAQTVYGSAKLMLETGMHPGELKDMVCSPSGTTIEGVRTLEEMGFRSAVINAVGACVEKSKKL